MKITKELTIYSSLILGLSILCFLAVYKVAPNFIYTFVAAIATIYFFPLKAILNKDINSIVSFIYFSIVIGLTVPMLFITSPELVMGYKVLAILNTVFLFYFLYKGNREFVIRHAVFMIFTPVIIL